MRTSPILLLLLGAAAASEPFFSTGQEYEFDYEGRLLSGVPELDYHFAGITLAGKVILQCVDETHFKLTMRNIEYNTFNQKLEGPEPHNWRTLETPSNRKVDSMYAKVLESPVEFFMQNGEISDIKVSENEPHWSVNIKKALVSLVKIQTPSGKHYLQENTVRAHGESTLPNIWKVMEQGVDGKCENTYHFTELPDYALFDVAYDLFDTSKCDKTIFQVVKTRDINNCVERTAYEVNQPGRYNCPTGNCDSMWERSSMARYIGCGTSAKDMEILAIIYDGEIQQSLMAYNTENFLTGVRQSLVLVESRSFKSDLNIESPRTVQDLLYEYPESMVMTESDRGSSSSWKPSSFKDLQDRLQEIIKDPREQRFKTIVPLDRDVILSKLSPDTFKQRILEHLTRIVDDLHEVEHLEKKEISMNLLMLSKVFGILSTDHMVSLYKNVKSMNVDEEKKETARQLVLELSVMSGSNAGIMFIKEMIESEELTPFRSGIYLTTIPHYIRTPDVKILDQIFELIKSPAIGKHYLLKTNAHLAFATLLNKACIEDNDYRYPVFVFGEFCNSETSELTNKYIPYMVDLLQSASGPEERESILLSVGAIGHESVIPILLPYIEGKSSGSSPREQRMAIYSLNMMTRRHRETLLPIFSTLVHNPSEDRYVRIAALSMMMTMDPSAYYFQKLATSTWFETDHEFHKFVFSTIKSLSEIDTEDHPTSGTFRTMSEHARSVLPLAKPLPGFFSSSLNFFTAEWMKKLQVGYQLHSSLTTTSSVQGLYARLEYFMEQLEFTPIEFCFMTEGTSSLYDHVKKYFVGDDSNSDFKIHPKWREVMSLINMKDTEEESFFAGGWVRLFDDVQFTFGRLHQGSVEKTLEYVRKFFQESRASKEDYCGRYPLNIVKINNWMPTEILIPSEMGLPILIEVHMPALLALKGELNVECSSSVPKLTLDVSSKTSVNFFGYVGTVCPFTKEVVAVGIDQHWAVNFPVRTEVELVQGKLKVNIIQSDDVKSSNKPIEMVVYHVKPFAVVKPYFFLDFTTLTSHSDVKYISSDSERKVYSRKIGHLVGLDMEYNMETESDVIDLKSRLDLFKQYNYNPINMMFYTWTQTAVTYDGRTTARYHCLSLLLNPSTSQTKVAEIELSLAMASKFYHDSEPKKVKIIRSRQGMYTVPSYELVPLTSGGADQYLERAFKKLKVQEGYAFTTEVKVSLKGGSPKTYTFTATGGHGVDKLERNWNLYIENKDRSLSNMNICVDGKVTLPNIYMKETEHIQTEDVAFQYFNNIGFGESCEEYFIKVTGSSSVSVGQLQKSRHSKAAHECKYYTNRFEYYQKKLSEARAYKKSVDEIREIHYKLSSKYLNMYQSCHEQLEQAHTLDKVNFHIEYKTLPDYVKPYTRLLDTYFKAFLLPYTTGFENVHSRDGIDIELKFRPRYNAVNMVFSSPYETITYENIRLPEYTRRLFPMTAFKQPHEQFYEAILGEPMYPTCRVSADTVYTFDNRSYSYSLDDCYHVLAADSSVSKSHAVLGKVEHEFTHLKIYTEGSEIILTPSSASGRHSLDYKVEVDGERIQVGRNEKKVVYSTDGKISYRFERSSDDVLLLVTPYNRISYDGYYVEIEGTGFYTAGDHTGLCGSLDGDESGDLRTAQQCVAQSEQAAALSFRVQKDCSELSEEYKLIKSREQTKCYRVESEDSYVTKLYADKLHECSQQRHSVVRQGDRLCISQIPVVECGSGCVPHGLATKTIGFSCLPANRDRVNRLYEDKVRRGEQLPELKTMDKDFSAEMEVPVSCTHPGQ